MSQDVPDAFEGTIDVAKIYFGGQWRNKRESVKRQNAQSKRGRGTTKSVVSGILVRNGRLWAELMKRVKAEELQP